MYILFVDRPVPPHVDIKVYETSDSILLTAPLCTSVVTYGGVYCLVLEESFSLFFRNKTMNTHKNETEVLEDKGVETVPPFLCRVPQRHLI